MSLWTTKLARHFIYTRFGVEYCRERERQLLHELGFRLRRLLDAAMASPAGEDPAAAGRGEPLEGGTSGP